MTSQTHRAIYSQPADLRNLLATRWDETETAATILGSARRVLIAGIGTSYHAAQFAGWLLRAVGIDARAVHAFDLALYPENVPLSREDALLVFGHTGNTSLTRRSLDCAVAAGVPVVAIGGNTARHEGAAVVIRTVDHEASTTYTTSHLTAMAATAMIATILGERRSRAQTSSFRTTLAALPDQIASILERASEIEPIAREAISRRIYVIGAGPNEVTATELMIKVREAAFCPIDGMTAEQFLHGPMVAVNSGDLAVVINVPGGGADRVTEISAVLSAIGALQWIVGQPIDSLHSTLFALPEVPELLSPLLALIPMQLLASQMADLNGANPDAFRCDDPIYLRAFSSLSF